MGTEGQIIAYRYMIAGTLYFYLKLQQTVHFPELMSACWMTMVLFGISFLVFYALGMGAYRRQQFVFVRCNSSRPASNVFYHHIMQRGSEVRTYL